jgi:hypothetical protein
MKKFNIKFLSLALCTLCITSLIGCTSVPGQSKHSVSKIYNFSDGAAGWEHGFTDLPADYEEDIYELDFKHGDIPVSGKKDKGLMLQGHNRSDDLFMFIYKKLDIGDGLKPSSKYKVSLSFDLATNVAPGLIGIGGSPGSSVYVKAGAVSREPKIEIKDNAYEINLDKGNQASGGSEVLVLGNIEKKKSEDKSYEYKNFKKTFEVTTNEKGEAWIIIGTDSGFEGLTRLYYTNIKVDFRLK